MRPMILHALLALALTTPVPAADGNRLAYLDDGVNPYYPGLNFPKLITPQWVGEEGVEAVVVLAIDDMRDNPAKYEAVLRPILDRLKQIDGRAPVSIMTNRIDPNDPQLQAWLKEGLSIETHTLAHPCPLLQKGDFKAARDTYNGCIDLIAKVPGNTPVAFRMPCCDSLNTPSPRFYAEIFNQATPEGRFLSIDSSVFNILTADDPDLPRELVFDPDGRERFRKYLPFPAFVNTIENYPYPYVIGGKCWEFPCVVPSDWEAQNLHGVNNPKTVEDLKAALDAVVIKQGVFNLVFHPHGWIKPEQIVELIDHAQAKHGKKVRFLTFREAIDRLNQNLLDDNPLRSRDGEDNGIRLLDVNDDGLIDVLVGNDKEQRTRLWNPERRNWRETLLPTKLVVEQDREPHSRQVRFGIVRSNGRASMLVRHLYAGESVAGAWTFDGSSWIEDRSLLAALPPKFGTGMLGLDYGARLRDLDGDGRCELIHSSEEDAEEGSVYGFSESDERWSRLPFSMPEGVSVVFDRAPARFEPMSPSDVLRLDAGLRFLDLDEDGRLDLVYSNDTSYGIFLFESLQAGWARRVSAGRSDSSEALPPIVQVGGDSWVPRVSKGGEIRRGGPSYVSDNGFFVHSRHLWWQNEDTAALPDHVARRSFNDLLKDQEPTARSPVASLRSIRMAPGFRVELVASEPLVRDPIAFDWSPDGRLWVVEMGDYPLGEDGKGKPDGRVRVLEDADGDGKYDKSTVFLDGLSFPNGIMCWRGGVLISAAPDIFYAEDTDRDGKADRREILFTGFKEANPQHRVNGFALGLDGWVYAADGDSDRGVKSLKTGETFPLHGRDFRFNPDTGAFEAESSRSQFGRRRDDWGDWFGNNNSLWAWHYVLTDPVLRRNKSVTVATPWQSLEPNRRLYPISRLMARFNDLDNANLATSANSPEPYRDDLFGPDFPPSVFVSEPVHNVVHRLVLEPEGASFAGQRGPNEQRSEFLASSDNWSRFTQLRTGPDGALWVADMYRYVIEHPEWIPDDWEARIDLRAGHDMGRIYRFFPVDRKPRSFPKLNGLDPAGLVAAMDSPNGWVRDTCQRLLMHQDDRSIVPALERLARGSSRPRVRVQALATLDCLDALKSSPIATALHDPHPEVRRFAALRAGSLADDSPDVADGLVRLIEDPSPRVRFGVAVGLGDWNDPKAGAALANLLHRDSGEIWIRTAAITSAAPQIAATLKALFAISGAEGPPPSVIEPLFATLRATNDPSATRTLAETVIAPAAEGQYADWQLAAASALGGEAGLRQSLGDDERIGRMFAAVESIALDGSASTARRVLAARLLGGESVSENHRRILGQLLDPQVPPAVRSAALATLARGREPEIASTLLEGWKGYAPAVRVAVLDALLSRRPWSSTLLNSLEDRCIPPAEIGPAYRRRLLEHADASIRDRARAVFESASTDRTAVVDRYREEMAGHSPDAAHGAEVFRKTCATCHRLREEGHEVGPDLASLTDRSPEALLVAILDPNRSVEPTFAEYSVATTDGRVLAGLIASETSTGVTLRQQEGKDVVLLRDEIDALASTGRSLMPEGLENDHSPADVADLIAFLASAGPRPKQVEGNTPVLVHPAEDGSITLRASQAEIFGSSLTFEPKYGNLGYWSAPDDRAAWEFTVDRPGFYEVRLDWACDNSTAGDRFVLTVGRERIEGQVSGTGTWDDYRQTTLGGVKLPVGRLRLEVFPDGEIDGALMDLRSIRLIP